MNSLIIIMLPFFKNRIFLFDNVITRHRLNVFVIAFIILFFCILYQYFFLSDFYNNFPFKKLFLYWVEYNYDMQARLYISCKYKQVIAIYCIILRKINIDKFIFIFWTICYNIKPFIIL